MTAFDLQLNDSGAVCLFSGMLDMTAAADLDKGLRELPGKIKDAVPVTFDLKDVERIETSCAYIILRTRDALEASGHKVGFKNITPAQKALLKAISAKPIGDEEDDVDHEKFVHFVEDVGETTIDAGLSTVEVISFFGGVMLALWRVVSQPKHLRFVPIIMHIERAGLYAVPIVCLMSFLIGGIVAQQGAFQLRRFGADIFVVNLVGILVLRELGVLLTAIMFAGRSGSAYTAEIGSMKMREEVDAMRVIGLSPIEVLVIPRMVALIIALPLVTILSNLSALVGAMLVCWVYMGISPDAFVAQIHAAVPVDHVFIGLVKAPFMAVIIGIIACIEGLRVRGSTESLGKQTTASVVKSIFMVIVVDGIFAMVFAAMDL